MKIEVETLLIYFVIVVATIVATGVATIVTTDGDTTFAIGTKFVIEVADDIDITIVTHIAPDIATVTAIDIDTDVATEGATSTIDIYIYNILGFNPHTGCQVST